MQFLTKAFAQIREHLGTLNTRDKLLFGLLIAVMAACFVWLIQVTATPELVSLLDQDISAQLPTIQNRLDMWEVTYRVENNRILVRRQERDNLLARLQFAKALPKDTREGWRKLIEETNMWTPAKVQDQRWQLAQQEHLAQVAGQMPGVGYAEVIINPGSKRGFSGGPSSDPSASVYLQMGAGGKPSKKLIEAVADLVAGAVHRLERDRVNVIVDGASYRLPDADSAFAGDLLELRRKWERHYSQKIAHTLGIPNVLVGVNIQLQTEEILTKKETYGEIMPSKEVTSETTSASGEQPGEPGVRPNTGGSVSVAEGYMENSTERTTETEFDGKRDVETVEKHSPPGEIELIHATVNVPNSYFVRIYQLQMGKDDQPTPAELEKVFQSHQDEIRKKVLPLIGEDTASIKQVQVSRYYDQRMDLGPARVEASGSGLGGFGHGRQTTLTQYAKPVGLAVLALSSLMMVLMMMRKAASGVGVPGIEEPSDHQKQPDQPPPALDTGARPIGEADQMDGVLHGVEIDEQTVRVREMSEQVAGLVKDDPNAASALVKQWIDQDL